MALAVAAAASPLSAERMPRGDACLPGAVWEGGGAEAKDHTCGNSTPHPQPHHSGRPASAGAEATLGSAEGVAGMAWLAFAFTDL